MSDFFTELSKDEDVSISDRKVNPVLYSNSSNPEIVILSDILLDKPAIGYLTKNLIFREIGNVKLKILYTFPYRLRPNEVKNQLVNYYYDNSIDLNEYIKPGTKVVTIGRSIYAITDNADIQPSTFYDMMLYNTSFYAPEIKCHVFPVDHLYSWFGDNAEPFPRFFALMQLRMAKEFVQETSQRIVKPRLTMVEDPNAFLREHWDETVVAFDLETTGLNWMTRDIHCMTLAFNRKEGFYLPWEKVDPELLNEFFKGKYTIAANGKFDMKFLRNYGVDVRVNFDTLHAGHTLNEMRSNSLKTHAWIYTPYGGYDNELDRYKKANSRVKDNYSLIPVEILFPYATMDAVVTFMVYEEMVEELKALDKKFPMNNGWSLQRYLDEIRFPTANMFADIEIEGWMVDWDRVKELYDFFDGEIQKVRAEIYRQLKTSDAVLDINSTTQLGTYFEYALKWPCMGRSKEKPNPKMIYRFQDNGDMSIIDKADIDGAYLTSDECLNRWKKEGYAVTEDILKYRELVKLRDTYLGREEDNSGFWQWRQPDGKIHSDFLVMMANSHRNRSKNPNLQNLPKHGKYAEMVRSIFICPPGYQFGDVDFSGLQLRIGAILSGDVVMKEIFTQLSGDMHSMTAQSVLMRDVSLEEFMRRKKEHEFSLTRYKAKGINFGFEFGSSAFAFAHDTLQQEWTQEECEAYIMEHGLTTLYARLVNLAHNREEADETSDAEFIDRPSVITPEEIEENRKFCYYWAVAIDIRKKFFETYQGLEAWIEQTRKGAIHNGFVRSPFGAIRRLPQLLAYSDEILEASPNGFVKNLLNISLNSPVQNFEIAIVSLGMLDIYRTRGFQSKIIGMIHDSCLFYIADEEVDTMKSLIQNSFEQERPEYKDIPIKIEGELADPREGVSQGFGVEWI